MNTYIALIASHNRQWTWWTWLESVILFPSSALFPSLLATILHPPILIALPSKMIGCCCAITLYCAFNYACKAKLGLFHFCNAAMAIDNSNMIAIGQSMLFKSHWSMSDLWRNMQLGWHLGLQSLSPIRWSSPPHSVQAVWLGDGCSYWMRG